MTVDSFSAYVELNEQFHRIIVDLADSAVLSRQIARAVSLPFASASAFVMVQARLPEAQTMFTVAQDHHRCIVRAIEAREGQRAEALMPSTPAWRAEISSSRYAIGRRADSCRVRIPSLF